MKTNLLRATASVVVLAIAACGGSVEEPLGDHGGDAGAGSSGDHSSSGSLASGASSSIDVSTGTTVTTYTTAISGSTFVTSSTITTTTTLSAGSSSVTASACVDATVDPSQQTCTTSSDCTFSASGDICSGQCACGVTPVNQATAKQIEAETAGLMLEDCPCAALGVPTCVFGLCVTCGGPNPPGGCPGTLSDAGPPGTCVDVNLAAYDTSCKRASDCVLVTGGEVCDGQCLCGGSPVSASEEATYQQAISGIQIAECSCPEGPDPVCSHGKCVLPPTGG